MMEGESNKSAEIPRIVRWYFVLFEGLGGTLMGILVFVMALQVLMRYGFNASLIWAEELCRYLLIWMTFFMIGVSYHRGQLIAIDFVVLAIPPVARVIVQCVMAVPTVVFLVYMIINGYAFAVQLQAQVIPAFNFLWQSITGSGATPNISIFWLYASVSLGCSLLAIHIVVSALAGAWTQFVKKSPAKASPSEN